MFHLFVICACVPLSAWRVYVLLILWTWFLTPVFNVAAPSFFLAWGSLITLSLIFDKPEYSNSGDPDAKEKTMQYLAFAAFTPLFALGFGWLIKTFGGL